MSAAAQHPKHRVAAVAALVLASLLGACADSTQPGITAPDAVAGARLRTAPSAPRNVAATGGDAQARVTWSQPYTVGRGGITSYTVTSVPGNISVRVGGSTLAATVTGLVNGTAYRFTVVAANAYGTGPASAPSNSVTPQGQQATSTAPGAPTSVQATAGNASASLSWTAPTSTGGSAISSYRVTTSPGGAVTTVAAPSTTATITGLTNGTTYTFTVAAVNSIGTGPASAPSNAVTPQAPPPPPPSGSSGRWVTGYWIGYQRSQYPEGQVDMTLLTHVVTGAIEPTGAGAGLDTTFFLDNVTGPAAARTLSSRAHAAGRKALLMLGGDGYGTALATATNATNRATFVRNLLTVVDRFGYDGVDVDWEPITSAPQSQILAFLQDLRAARPGLIVTFPVGWAAYDVTSFYAQVAPLVDQLNLMSYDMAGNWSGWVSWHSSALLDDAANRPSSIAKSIAAYRAVGVPAAKLGVGSGFYGQCWRGVTAPRQALSSGAGVVAGDNTMSYANIMASYYSAGSYRYDDLAKVPYLTFASGTGPQGCTYVTYEDERSLADKAAWVKAQGLGGAIVWTINQGHLASPVNGTQDPLLKALYSNLVP